MCGHTADAANLRDAIYKYECPVCGEFLITDKTATALETQRNIEGVDRTKISAFTRARTLRGATPLLIDYNEPTFSPSVTFKEMNERFPQSVGQRLEETLLNLSLLSDYPGYVVEVTPDEDYPIFYVATTEDAGVQMDYIARALEAAGFISILYPNKDNFSIQLTPSGWAEVASLVNSGTRPPKAFTAMWFNPEVANAYELAIKKAVTESGYASVRIDQQEYNGIIDDAIVAEIRRSHFVICDFTGNRPGVYFEAGFALGLGKQTIFTCRNTKKDKRKLHFDTNHYNYIFWNTEEELYTRLLNRIQATIL
jgi:hypothetical protein